MNSEDAAITLAFCENFPDEEWAGRSVELRCSTRRTTGSLVQHWLIGRHEDIKDSKDIKLSNKLFSRIHATIRYRAQLDQWQILNGGVYGDNDYHASTNGVWLNGERLPPGRWVPINPNDKISLGRDLGARIILRGSLHDTINSFEWDGSGWPPQQVATKGPKPPGALEESEISELKQALKPSQASPWSLAQDLLDWLQEPPKSALDGVWKIAIALLAIAAAGLVFAIAAHVAIGEEAPSQSPELIEPGD
ncbi:MAG TPA: FHA domain-containing protein [Trichocoleus sp.]